MRPQVIMQWHPATPRADIALQHIAPTKHAQQNTLAIDKAPKYARR